MDRVRRISGTPFTKVTHVLLQLRLSNACGGVGGITAGCPWVAIISTVRCCTRRSSIMITRIMAFGISMPTYLSLRVQAFSSRTGWRWSVECGVCSEVCGLWSVEWRKTGVGNYPSSWKLKPLNQKLKPLSQTLTLSRVRKKKSRSQNIKTPESETKNLRLRNSNTGEER